MLDLRDKSKMELYFVFFKVFRFYYKDVCMFNVVVWMRIDI